MNPQSFTGRDIRPSELWGVSQGPHNRKRSEAARARRKAKRMAKLKNLTLKAYLRKQK